MNFDDMVLDLGSMSTVTLGNIDDTITLDFGDLHSTWPGLSVAGDVGLNNSLSTSVSGQLTGDAADLTINGVSLAKTLEGIQQRLNMLQPNPEMEAQWDELRELGQRYRELEQQCIEKSRMWAQLTSMPPPEIS
jgi:hypothetical protein